MKILLVHPPLPCNERHKRILPLSLGYLASYLLKNLPEVEVKILDAHVLNFNYSQTMKEINKGKWDIIGITYWTPQSPFAYNISKAIKQNNPDAFVVHGGVHASLCPQEAVEYADVCVLHEGEIAFCELVKKMMEGKSFKEINGIAYKENGEMCRTPNSPMIKDLDSIPFPAWDLLPMECYTTPLHVVGGKRMPVIGSRGCPYNCSYCVSPLMWLREVRWRSPENVLEELKEIIKKFQIPQFHFWDDNFLLNREYVTGLCEGILKENLKIKWTGLTRASHIEKNKDLIGLLARAGCIGLEVGIESADPNTFLQIHKDESLSVIEDVAKLQKENGMHPLFTYMAFNPGETITGYYLQAQFIDKILSNLGWIEHFHPLPFSIYIGQFSTPYPRTQLMDDVKKLGVSLVESWDDCFHHNINFIPRSLLDDIPEKTSGRLKANDYLICVRAAWAGIWDFASFSLPRRERFKEQLDYVKFLSSFYARCNGSETLEKIAADLSEFLNISLKKSLQYSAFSTLILAQMGLIRSSLHSLDLDIKQKKINVPWERGIKKIIKRILFLLYVKIYALLAK
ncbi:MAG: hypothetical protein A2149_07310 [Candidatus Schekmanbacteria bacterium RBG_16_38_11]|uniref:Uncharacterized protein n=1 Tax=Candidatus Schekmanbacteria bacterium RBG_16_38_11 TaxID=1817880 RepID=A0A1F7RWY4_9BACT|nr:MAG: hypothetical protein A2149_07310 [Candidatus Schekmanbacteria bacterium RBG_16_38_11]